YRGCHHVTHSSTSPLYTFSPSSSSSLTPPPPSSTLFPYTTLFRSQRMCANMLKPIQKFVRLVSTKKGAKITLGIWLLAVLVFALFTQSASDYEGSSDEASINGDKPSEIAADLKEEEFPSDEGLTGLLVFHKDGEFKKEKNEEISKLTKWFDSDNKPDEVASSLPFHELPEEVQDQMFSDDGSTLLINMAIKKDISSDLTSDAL